MHLRENRSAVTQALGQETDIGGFYPSIERVPHAMGALRQRRQKELLANEKTHVKTPYKHELRDSTSQHPEGAPAPFLFDYARQFGHDREMKEWHGDDIEEEVTVEPEVGEEAGEARPEEKIAKMREELSACRKDKQEYMDGWQRAKADYVNALKRFETDNKAAEFKGKVKAVETLLPAFDALERAKEHLEARPPSKEDFLAIAKQLESAFATLGLEETGKVGEKFDPAFHEALGQDKVESADEDDIITAILERGWRVGDSIIRPAKVRVGHFA
jgi:molecular chaperone GrpE